MSMTAVPISIRLVRAPTAASSGKGDPSCLAKWCTRKYAPSAPSSSAATARSIDCSNASDADCVREPGDDDQCPNDKKPIFFTRASTRATRAAFLADTTSDLNLVTVDSGVSRCESNMWRGYCRRGYWRLDARGETAAAVGIRAGFRAG